MEKGNLYKSKVYLAGNIQHTVDSVVWREELTVPLEKMGIITLNPRVNCFLNQISEDDEVIKRLRLDILNENYDAVSDSVKQIIRRDLRMVDVADFIIVNLEPTMPTFGTVHEIILASTQRKPIFFRINDKKDFPIWFFGLFDHNLIFNTFGEIIEYLWNINYSLDVHELNNKYWKVFKENFR